MTTTTSQETQQLYYIQHWEKKTKHEDYDYSPNPFLAGPFRCLENRRDGIRCAMHLRFSQHYRTSGETPPREREKKNKSRNMLLFLGLSHIMRERK